MENDNFQITRKAFKKYALHYDISFLLFHVIRRVKDLNFYLRVFIYSFIHTFTRIWTGTPGDTSNKSEHTPSNYRMFSE